MLFTLSTYLLWYSSLLVLYSYPRKKPFTGRPLSTPPSSALSFRNRNLGNLHHFYCQSFSVQKLTFLPIFRCTLISERYTVYDATS